MEPATLYFRYRELVEWLRSQGISEHETEKLIEMKVIEKKQLHTGSKAHYSRKQVKAALEGLGF